ncbi:MAG: 5'/3'-nucleotidase SurE [Spirochaetales bacterium]|nr:5'/3'-nucleotidase SurE [Spirochaetales bacterium]
MHILITNDDGISSHHLIALAHRLATDHEVWVIAPAKERSACSHAITLLRPLVVQEEQPQWYSCSGTPADCVLLALSGFLPITIDLVISGINRGPNLGSDIIYSGTAAGARQGAFMKTPAIAVSINSYDKSLVIDSHVEFIAQNLDNFLEIWKPDCFLNINFPKIINNNSHVEITFPCKRVYNDKLTRFSGPDGKIYCFLKGNIDPANEKGSDYYIVEQQNISISLISVQPGHKPVDEIFHSLSFRKGEKN